MIGGILYNTKLERYHPIWFRPAPMPSGADIDYQMLRHRSFGHHTDGFATLEAAQSSVTDVCAKSEGEHHDSGAVWAWDGEGIPAMTQWYTNPWKAAS